MWGLVLLIVAGFLVCFLGFASGLVCATVVWRMCTCYWMFDLSDWCICGFFGLGVSVGLRFLAA